MNPRVIFIMGVSGSGKTTAAKALAAETSLPFIDADDVHPEVNISKMKAGIPLQDADRWPWLERLNILAKEHLEKYGVVIACSALKAAYREKLEEDIADQTIWVYLKGDYSLILQRMKSRQHFMPPELLKSQFDTLEEPDHAITISIDQLEEAMITDLLNQLGNG